MFIFFAALREGRSWGGGGGSKRVRCCVPWLVVVAWPWLDLAWLSCDEFCVVVTILYLVCCWPRLLPRLAGGDVASCFVVPVPRSRVRFLFFILCGGRDDGGNTDGGNDGGNDGGTDGDKQARWLAFLLPVAAVDIDDLRALRVFRHER